MKNISKYIFVLLTAVMASSCIKEVLPVGGSQTQDQVSASKTAMLSMIKAVPASMTTSGTIGYASSYGDHTDFGIPGIHLRLEHMLEDMATMAENPFYNRFYAYDMNEAQGYQYTYCAYFWDAYYTWIRLVNDVVLSIKPVVEEMEGSGPLGSSVFDVQVRVLSSAPRIKRQSILMDCRFIRVFSRLYNKIPKPFAPTSE